VAAGVPRVMSDPRIDAARRLIVDLASAHGAAREPQTVDSILVGLVEVARELSASRQTERRIEELVDSLYALASMDFTKRPTLRDDGSPMDAAVGCIVMLSEELAAYVEEHARIEEELETRVRERTNELVRANASLQQEVLDRTRAEDTLRAREEQLVQASKMAAVGQLAAGVAHEINNPLAVILGFAQGLERRVSTTDHAFRSPVTSIVREALRCKNLVHELLTFSRTGRQSREALDFQVVVHAASQLLESRARVQDTAIHVDVGEGLPMVRGNRTQLEQVVINLGNNALDAMEKGGELTVRSRYSGNGEVHLEVRDTGPGIPADIRSRIFEPFFTTKEVGKGTGLGLSLAYEVVQQHGGSLDVESEIGKGTTMRVRLPIDAEPALTEPSK